MAHYMGTVSLSDIERIQIYNKKRRNTKAGMKQVMKETGGDIVISGPIFLKSYKACCHLKTNGKVLCQPDYQAWAIAWTRPLDFGVCVVPISTKSNWMECVHAIVAGKKISPMKYGKDMAYATNRVVIGTKNGNFAYLATENNYTPEQVRDICYEDGWDNAIMMDGGGTACILFSDGTGFAGDGRYVPFWIVIHLKKGPCPYVEPTTSIKSGSKGEGAKWVQWHLNKHGYALIVDGVFGKKSVMALKNFQQSEDLTKDGICGPATRKALKQF